MREKGLLFFAPGEECGISSRDGASGKQVKFRASNFEFPVSTFKVGLLMSLKRKLSSLLKSRAPALVLGILLLAVRSAAQIPPPMPPEKAVELYGQSIHYYDAGQGPNLIFVHGLGGQAANWAANIGPLSQKQHVYALDQIGFGHSDKPLIDYKIATFVDFLYAFMQTLGIPKATLVGNSLGGWIVVDFTALHPEMVDKLVLVDAAGVRSEGGPHTLPVDLNPSSLEGMRKVLEFIFYNKQAVTDDLVRHAFEGHLRSGDGYTIQRVLAGIFDTDQFEDGKLHSIHAPTLVLWGHDDLLTPLPLGERYQKGIPGAKLVVIDQCGHVPQSEKPQELNKLLMDFLAQP